MSTISGDQPSVNLSAANVTLIVPQLFEQSIDMSSEITVYYEDLTATVNVRKTFNFDIPVSVLNNVLTFDATEANSANGSIGASNVKVDLRPLASVVSLSEFAAQLDSGAHWTNTYNPSEDTVGDSAGVAMRTPYGDYRAFLRGAGAEKVNTQDVAVAAETHTNWVQSPLFESGSGLMYCETDSTAAKNFFDNAMRAGRVEHDLAEDGIGEGQNVSSNDLHLTLSEGDAIAAYVKFNANYTLAWYRENAGVDAGLAEIFSEDAATNGSSANGLEMLINRTLVTLTDASEERHDYYKFVFNAVADPSEG
jgi:hypothetical protein